MELICARCYKPIRDGQNYATVRRGGCVLTYHHTDDVEGPSCYESSTMQDYPEFDALSETPTTIGELATWLKEHPGPQDLGNGMTGEYKGSFPYADEWDTPKES